MFSRVLARIREIGCAFPKVGSASLNHELGNAEFATPKALLGESMRGVKPPLIGGGPGGLPRKIFEI